MASEIQFSHANAKIKTVSVALDRHIQKTMKEKIKRDKQNELE